MQERIVSQCQHQYVGTACKKCFVYHHQQDQAVKTNMYQSVMNCSHEESLQHMRSLVPKYLSTKSLQDQTYLLLNSICDKFQFGLQTLALGVYLYNKVFKCSHEGKQQRFWASATLMAAAKSIELDKKVPYYHRYQRYAQTSYSQKQYQDAEYKIFNLLGFDMIYPTFVSYLNFYLTCGIIFKSDMLYQGSVKYLQDELINKARLYLKNGQFLSHNPQKFALRMIKQVRNKYRLKSWTNALQIISGFSTQQVGQIQNTQVLKPHSFSRANSMTSSSIQIGIIDDKLKFSKKKTDIQSKQNPIISVFKQNEKQQGQKKQQGNLKQNYNHSNRLIALKQIRDPYPSSRIMKLKQNANRQVKKLPTISSSQIYQPHNIGQMKNGITRYGSILSNASLDKMSLNSFTRRI